MKIKKPKFGKMKGMNFLVVITMTFVISIIATLILAGVAGGQGSEITNFGNNQTDKAGSIADDSTNSIISGNGGSSSQNQNSAGPGGGSSTVSNNIEESKIEDTFFVATEDTGDNGFDGWKYINVKNPDSGVTERLEYSMDKNNFWGKFGSDYYREAPSVASDRGGATKRYIWVKNEKNGKNITSTVQDGTNGRVSLPDNIQGINNNNDDLNNVKDKDGGQSIKLGVENIDTEWKWSEQSLVSKNYDMEGEGEFTDIYPGENKFNLRLIENSTEALMEEATFTINKPYNFKVYYVNDGGASTKLSQPSEKPAWDYSTGKNSKASSKKEQVLWEAKSNSKINIDPKFVAEFPKTSNSDKYELDVEKVSGEGSNRPQAGPVNENKKSGQSGSEKIVIDSSDVSNEVSSCTATGSPDVWGLMCDRSDNAGSDYDKSKIKVSLEDINNGNTIIEETFAFKHWGCVGPANANCLSP